MDYKKAYCYLFNQITKAAEQIEQSRIRSQAIEDALQTLKSAQQATEEMYMSEK